MAIRHQSLTPSRLRRCALCLHPAVMGGACGATLRNAAASCAKVCRPRRWRFAPVRHEGRFTDTPRLNNVVAICDKECSRSSLGYWPCPRQGASLRSRAGLSVVGHRRSFVPGNGLCPPDRRRERHARPDLVAQQATGGVTAAHRAPPIAAGAVKHRQSMREHFTLLVLQGVEPRK